MQTAQSVPTTFQYRKQVSASMTHRSPSSMGSRSPVGMAPTGQLVAHLEQVVQKSSTERSSPGRLDASGSSVVTTPIRTRGPRRRVFVSRLVVPKRRAQLNANTFYDSDPAERQVGALFLDNGSGQLLDLFAY